MRLFWGLLFVCVALPLIAGCSTLDGRSDKVMHYVNPLGVSIADPLILKDGADYYLYGTTDSDNGFEVFHSSDLAHWSRKGYCYRETPESWGQRDFWAPEVIKVDNTYYLFYTSFNPKAYIRNICVAVSDSPLGPFKDKTTPLITGGRAFIDASPFYDPESKRYYVYLMEENISPSKIFVGRLSTDMLSVDTELTECFGGAQTWEFGWVEGPYVIKHDDTYYMMYSGEGYADSRYSVGYATAPKPTGPWTKAAENPILKKTAQVSGPGHNSLTTSPDGKELFTAYHRHLTFAGSWQRELAIDRVEFVKNGDKPDLMKIVGPTHLPQRLPSGSKPHEWARSDQFDAPELDRNRWTIFGENQDRWKLEDGRLCIVTDPGDFWTNRVDAKNIFLQEVPDGDFTIQTKVDFQPKANFEQAFLVLWQDQSNFIRLASIFSTKKVFESAKEVDGCFDVVSIPNPLQGDVYLRIEKRGNHYTCLISGAGVSWTPIGSGWDANFSNLKIGIGAISPASGAARTARFDYFDLTRP